MFSAQERDRIWEQLLARAEADDAITGDAFTGSLATGDGDRWSDTDLVLAGRGELTAAVDRWARWLDDELGAVASSAAAGGKPSTGSAPSAIT